MPKWFIGPNVWSDRVMSVAEAAYMAGFIDGEGTIGLYRARRRESKSGYRLQPHLAVANTDLRALEEIQRMCGNGRIVQQTHERLPHHKPGYTIRFSPNQMRHILPQLMPYLLIKKRQAEYLMEFLSFAIGGRNLNKEQVARADEIRESVRGLNKRGVTVSEAIN